MGNGPLYLTLLAGPLQAVPVPKPVMDALVSAQVTEQRKIGGRFYFDTGAGLCTLLSADFASDSAVLGSQKKTYYTQAQGLGGKATMRLTTVKEVKFGPYRFKRVSTYIFDDKYNVTGAFVGSASETRWGGTVGTGVEIGFAPGWSVAFEYNHLFMGSSNHTFSTPAGALIPGFVTRGERISEDVDMGTVRVNYTFGGPVVAKY